MTDTDPLRAQWRERNALQAVNGSMTITEDGLVLGAGTVLAAMERVLGKCGGLDLDGGEERLLALLAAFCGQPVEPKVLDNI